MKYTLNNIYNIGKLYDVLKITLKRKPGWKDYLRSQNLEGFVLVFEKSNLVIWANSNDDTVEVQLEKTVEIPARYQLMSLKADSPWQEAIGKNIFYFWTMTNQKGYKDGLQLQFISADNYVTEELTLQLMAAASTFTLYTLKEKAAEKLLQYDLYRHGWASCTIFLPQTTLRLRPISYLSDAFGDMIKAFNELKQGKTKVSWIFAHEPGTTEFVVQKLKNNMVKLVLNFYSDTVVQSLSRKNTAKKIILKKTTTKNENEKNIKVSPEYSIEHLVSWEALLSNIIENGDWLLKKHGMKKYKELWKNFDFPLKEFVLLNNDDKKNQRIL